MVLSLWDFSALMSFLYFLHLFAHKLFIYIDNISL